MREIAITLLLAACLPARSGGASGGRTMPVDTRETPWRVVYSDGSANSLRFWRDSRRAPARFEYTPVRPEESSTGMYSGGEPKKGRLDAARARELWRWVERLEADPALRASSRDKGTGAFRIEEGGRTRGFIIADGPLLREFDASLAAFRGGRRGIVPGDR